MRSVFALLAFAASALAFQVTQPTNATGWTVDGPNVVAWNAVSTDQANFTIVLVNQNVFPPTSQILAALVDSTLGKMTVNPPSTGFHVGKGFQVNLVKDSQHTDSILAQSEQFSITQASSTLSATATGAQAGSSVLTIPAASTPAGTTPDSTSSADPLNPSQTGTSPDNNNGASPAMGMQAGFFAGLALLGAFLA